MDGSHTIVQFIGGRWQQMGFVMSFEMTQAEVDECFGAGPHELKCQHVYYDGYMLAKTGPNTIEISTPHSVHEWNQVAQEWHRKPLLKQMSERTPRKKRPFYRELEGKKW